MIRKSPALSSLNYSPKISPNIFALVLIFLSFQIIYSQTSAPAAQKPVEIINLELNAPIEHEFTDAAKKKHIYKISLSANQYANVVIEQQSVDVAAQIFAPDERLIADVDSDARSAHGLEKIELVAATAGDYRIEVKPSLPKAAAGKYSIRLVELRAATADEKSLDEARRYFYEGRRLDDAGKYDDALASASRALEIREKISGESGADAADSLLSLGTICSDKNDFEQAEKFFERAKDAIAKTAGVESLSYADALHGLARVRFNQDDFTEAERLNLRALAVREKAAGADSLAAAKSLFSLGLLYRVTNDIPKAERMYLRVLAIREKLLGAEHLEVGLVENNLGFLYYTVGDYANADSFYRRSLAIKEKNLGAEHPVVGMTLINMGLVEWKKADYQKAENYWKRALGIFEKSSGGESNSVATCLHNLGIVYKETGDYAKSEEYYGRALAMWEKILGKDSPRTAIAVSSLGILYRATGDYERAEKFHLRELTIYEKTYGQNHPETALSLDNLARLYAEKGDIQRSLEYQKRVVAIEEKNISLSLTIGSERQKIAFFTTQIQKPDRIISLHAQLAPDSIEARDLAATVVLSRKGRILDALAENLSALRERSDAPSQALIDRFNDSNSRLSRLILNGAQKTPVEEYQKQILDYERQREQLESEIARRSEDFYQSSQPVTLATVRAAIPADAALVEFAVYRPFTRKGKGGAGDYGEPRYIAYILRREGIIGWRELGEAKTIDAAIDNLRGALRDARRTDVQTLARAADAQIMQPVRALLGGDVKHLLVSPDGALNLIPFEALVDERNHYLIENYSFTYMTSERDLLRMQTARASKSKSLIIANPSFGESAATETVVSTKTGKTFAGRRRSSITAARNLSETYFAPLGATLSEARAIQMLFPDALLLTGMQASESALKQAVAPQILHIATHGFFLENADASKSANSEIAKRSSNAEEKIENPLLRSGLALTGANRHDKTGDDGILTALEASGLNLWGTKLVVLSACDTGLGEIKNGEGVYGLRRAFVLAGTESLVMSLWSVSDYTTRELMTNYYKNLKQGIGRGESLRQVQLAMIKRKERAHPFYWAGFIQSGEWANLDGKR